MSRRAIVLVFTLLCAIPLAASAKPVRAAPPIDEAICYGKVASIEASRATQDVTIWLDNLSCPPDMPHRTNASFRLGPSGLGTAWRAGVTIAAAAYAAAASGQPGGTVTVNFLRKKNKPKGYVPYVTRINTPCVSGPEGHSGPSGLCLP